MALKVYNTETRALAPFEPLDEGKVRVYACGPTIYDHAHIGNFRTFLFFDLVHRYLEWSGYEVRFVMNLTDVDDKTIEGAVAAEMSVAAFTQPFGDAFLEDSRTLGILPVDCYEAQARLDSARGAPGRPAALSGARAPRPRKSAGISPSAKTRPTATKASWYAPTLACHSITRRKCPMLLAACSIPARPAWAR